jgi:hypothetical protein
MCLLCGVWRHTPEQAPSGEKKEHSAKNRAQDGVEMGEKRQNEENITEFFMDMTNSKKIEYFGKNVLTNTAVYRTMRLKRRGACRTTRKTLWRR